MSEISVCNFCDSTLFPEDVFFSSDGSACICRSCIEEMHAILFTPDKMLPLDSQTTLEKLEVAKTAQTCAACSNHANGSVLEGNYFENGWHCTCFDVQGNHPVSLLDNVKLCVESGLIE